MRLANNPTPPDSQCPFGPSTELIRGAVDLLVLSALRKGPLTILEIESEIERLADDRLTPQAQVVSRALERLRLNGWVRRRLCVGSTGEYRYRLSESGERHVVDLQRAWLRLSHATTAVVYATTTHAHDPAARQDVAH